MKTLDEAVAEAIAEMHLTGCTPFRAVKRVHDDWLTAAQSADDEFMFALLTRVTAARKDNV